MKDDDNYGILVLRKYGNGAQLEADVEKVVVSSSVGLSNALRMWRMMMDLSMRGQCWRLLKM